jgi:hypothetical protein
MKPVAIADARKFGTDQSREIASSSRSNDRPPVSAFAQTAVAIFAIVNEQPETSNTQRHFHRSKNNEYLLHHRRGGCGRRPSWSASLMNRPLADAQPFTSRQHLAKAVEYADLARRSIGSAERQKFQQLEGRHSVLAVLADNDELLQERNASRAIQQDESSRMTPAAEDQVLRCLGAVLIMQWNTLPAKLQRELFDHAGDMGELLDTSAVREKIARFLHTHKNDETNGGAKERYK